MKRPVRVAVYGLIAAVIGYFSLTNASWIAGAPSGTLKLIAHRGVAQQFSRKGVDNKTCTATRINPPEHLFIENSLLGIDQAFLNGADYVQIDVQRTRDNRIAVFHDAKLDCRTNGKGEIGERALADLKTLDIGYGYTADGGKSYPLRGKGIGKLPSLDDVLKAHPRRQFLIQFKGNRTEDADAVIATYKRFGFALGERTVFLGGERPVARMAQTDASLWLWQKHLMKACFTDYLKFGWLGTVPETCRGKTMMVPLNYQWLLWGWPNRFQQRMADANVRVVMAGPYKKDRPIAGITTAEDVRKIPDSFKGYLWVEDIYNIGPGLRPR